VRNERAGTDHSNTAAQAERRVEDGASFLDSRRDAHETEPSKVPPAPPAIFASQNLSSHVRSLLENMVG
jgi:hypothetical protein